MKTFLCGHCASVVFFENVVCGNCGSALGFIHEELEMAAFEQPQGDPRQGWRRLGARRAGGRTHWRPCANYVGRQVCNWMASGNEVLCRCCTHTEYTPALDDPASQGHWYRLETAKRWLFYSVFRLGLPIDAGLSFRFQGGTHDPVTTGHAGGTITLDIGEADDAQREARRLSLNEPYRTLLGHFRHEIGHFYWDRLIANTHRLDAFREIFGDERRDYGEAVRAYYAGSPPPNWPARFISAYATMHPWEDWAETWAHYLHIVDALDTAEHWGLALQPQRTAPPAPARLPRVCARGGSFREVLLDQWLPLSQFLNSMARSLGQGDAYPFVIAPAVVDKLCFVDRLVQDVREAASRQAVAVQGGVQ